MQEKYQQAFSESHKLLFQHIGAGLSHKNMELTKITGGGNLFREIFYLFRGVLFINSEGGGDHQRVTAENEIKTGLEI